MLFVIDGAKGAAQGNPRLVRTVRHRRRRALSPCVRGVAGTRPPGAASSLLLEGLNGPLSTLRSMNAIENPNGGIGPVRAQVKSWQGSRCCYASRRCGRACLGRLTSRVRSRQRRVQITL